MSAIWEIRICEVFSNAEINEEFFEALFGDSPGFVRDFKQETLDIFFKELLSYYPRETFTNKKVLSCLINVGLIRILFKNGIEVDLQGVAYNPRVIKHYLDEDLQTFLKLLELHLEILEDSEHKEEILSLLKIK